MGPLEADPHSEALEETLPADADRVFHMTRWAILASTALNLALGSGSAALAYVLLARGDWTGAAFAGFTAVAGWSAFAWLRRWRAGGTVLTLTADGIEDAMGLGAPRFIPWSDVTSVSTAAGECTLVLREDSGVRVAWHRRLLSWLARKRRHEYLLPTRGLDEPHDVIGTVLRQKHEQLLLDDVKSRSLPGSP